MHLRQFSRVRKTRKTFTVSGELGNSVKDLGEGVGNAVEDVGDAVGNAAEGR